VVEPPPKDLLDKLKKLIGPQGDTILDRPISGKLVKCHIGWGDDEAQQLYLKFSGEMDFNEDGERRRYELGMRAAAPGPLRQRNRLMFCELNTA